MLCKGVKGHVRIDLDDLVVCEITRRVSGRTGTCTTTPGTHSWSADGGNGDANVQFKKFSESRLLNFRDFVCLFVFCDFVIALFWTHTRTHTLCPLKCNPSDRKASKKDSIIRHRQESNVFCFVFLHLLFKSRTLLIVWLISDSFPHFLCDRAT